MTILKFRHGDTVYTQYNNRAKIIRSFGMNGKIMYEIQIEDTGDIKQYEEDALSFTPLNELNRPKKSDNFKPPTPKCPKCNTNWKVTKYGRNIWYDCETCKDTAENLCEKEKKITSYWI